LIALTISFVTLVIAVQFLGQIFFVNRTESMSRGIYVKKFSRELETGDIIVLKSNHFKGSLLKYVAAKFPGEFCIDDGDTLFIADQIVGQQNIEKYSLGDSPTCRCQSLASNELLVVGDHPDSYDSRYFGPVKNTDVIARVELLWEFAKHQ
jgi:type IV secretory pathway protease TraF